MATRYDCLPGSQRRLLPSLAPLRGLGFVLYGGTAIALRLGHRISIDFDFFADGTIDHSAIMHAAPFLEEATTLQDERNTWTIQTSERTTHERPVKISFFTGLRFGRVGQPVLADNGDLSLASLDDLLGHKLKVLLQRVEAKDYQDIAAMLRGGQSLERGAGAAMSLFPNFQPHEALKALVYYGDGDLSGVSIGDRATLIAHAGRFTEAAAMPILSRTLHDDVSDRNS